ncbi:50S ribosomal protein L13 [Prevotella nigrescens ATCC 33563]|nr:50S ribosomal protein L13 [Prevotella nigrescens ATCC 33563]
MVSESDGQALKTFFSSKILKLKMDTLSYKTISVNKETAKKEWVVVDATDQVVGRFCSKVAKLLRGKYKPTFTPHVDCGDNVIIINADKVRFTGKKETDKVYTHYTGYPGGQRFNTPAQLRTKKNGVEKIVRHAVKGMLPKGILGRHLLNNLYVFEGSELNGLEAQKPKSIDINQYK